MAWAGIVLLLPYLRARAVLDVPNARSNHTVPTPRGAGIAVIGAALIFLAVLHAPGAVMLGAAALALISWHDDRSGLSPQMRLLWQFLAVMLAWPALPHGTLISIWLELPLGVLLWMGFTNIYNFMDGIDEITAVETLSIALGMTAVYLVHPGLPFVLVEYALIIAAATAAFWLFNRHPAKIFIGDVGSIPLGFLIAWLLLLLATSGLWAAAFILPGYYLADGGITLARRIVARENILQAHSQHYYQRAVASGLRHDAVAHRIFGLNLLLIALACASTAGIVPALASLVAAYACILAVLHQFAGAHDTIA